MALVSVVIPTCDRPRFLAAALDSVLAQSLQDFVVLVGDDSESAQTDRLLAGLTDPRIRIHRNRPVLGATANWLNLIQMVETPYVATLHDDDKWHPQFLELLLGPLVDDPGIAMSYCDFWLIDENDQTRFALTEQEAARSGRDTTPTEELRYDLAEGLRLVAIDAAPQLGCGAVLRTDAIQDIPVPSDVEPLYGPWCSYRLVKQRRRLFYVGKRLASHRVYAESPSDRGYGDAEDALLRRIIEENPDAGPVLEEIQAYWSSLQWARGSRLMDSLASLKPSQEQLANAVPSLEGVKAILASAATRLWRSGT